MSQYHAKYYSQFLTLKKPSRWADRLGNSLLNATIDLNPHQVDAALFFFDNPLNKGIMLADEVGLWKTIEAGLILCQLWSEMKRKVLLVVPASLRKQRVAELQEKFHLPAKIIDWPIYRKIADEGDVNPFDQEAIIITSYAFASSENTEKYPIADHIDSIKRDVVVFDEAHKLRNVYKDLDSDLDDFFDKETVEKTKKRSTAKKLFDRFEFTKKLLLTATPLQNSLLELFGLMNFVDPYSFADIESFKEQYNPQTVTERDLVDLRKRIQPFFHRTLRKQVASDIKYTQRKPLTQEYEWSLEEQKFYDQMSEFLRTSSLFQNKNGQVNYLMVLIYRKLLASSVPAILGTLRGLEKRIEREKQEVLTKNKKTQEVWETTIDDQDMLEIYKEEADEKEIDIPDTVGEIIDEEAITQLQYDQDRVREIIALGEQITDDNKAKALLQSIQTAYAQLAQLWASKKILIFTESRRTQDYLFGYLNQNGYDGKVVCFNGDNDSWMVRKIYGDWKAEYQHTAYFSGSVTSDTRASIVDYFKNSAEIMIATESASEGINLQFCSLVINYDLPWNPQRVEQRIGRCHRYGQLFDVIVMNLINTKNRADQRVFELLNQKFTLFQWLFGASDAVLGVLESGIDIEKTILDIFQTCRTTEQIDQAFDTLQQQMETVVASKMEETKEKVLNRLDEDVARRLKDKKQESELILSKMQERLMKLTQIECGDFAQMISPVALQIVRSPDGIIPTWTYSFDTKKTAGYLLRTADPLGQRCIQRWAERNLDHSQISFDLSSHETRISALETYKWQSWYFSISKLTINAFATEEYLVHSGITDSGEVLPEEVIEKMMNLKGDTKSTVISNDIIEKLKVREQQLMQGIKTSSREANEQYFVMEMDKLDHWADDLKVSLEKQRKAIKSEIGIMKKEYRWAQQLEEKVELQRKIRNLEQKESKLRREINELEDQIDAKKEVLIDEIEKRLDAQSEVKELFMVKWKII